MTQNLRTGYKILNKGDQAAAVLLDLSKAFHCIDYNPLLIKAKPTCSRKNCIDFMYFYLTTEKRKRQSIILIIFTITNTKIFKEIFILYKKMMTLCYYHVTYVF